MEYIHRSCNRYHYCGRRLDRREQSKDEGAGSEGHQGRKPWLPSKGQNWLSRTQADLSSPSTSLGTQFRPPTFHILVTQLGPSPDLSSPGTLLVLWVRPLRQGKDRRLEKNPEASSPQDNEVLTRIKYI